MSNKVRSIENYNRLITYLHSRLDENREVHISHRELATQLGIKRTLMVRLVAQLKTFNADWEVISGKWEACSGIPTPTTYRYTGK